MSLILLCEEPAAAAVRILTEEVGMDDSVMDLNRAALSLTLTSSSMCPCSCGSWAEGAAGQLVLEGRGAGVGGKALVGEGIVVVRFLGVGGNAGVGTSAVGDGDSFL